MNELRHSRLNILHKLRIVPAVVVLGCAALVSSCGGENNSEPTDVVKDVISPEDVINLCGPPKEGTHPAPRTSAGPSWAVEGVDTPKEAVSYNDQLREDLDFKELKRLRADADTVTFVIEGQLLINAVKVSKGWVPGASVECPRQSNQEIN